MQKQQETKTLAQDKCLVGTSLGLSYWFGAEESARQCRRRGFDPWVGKIPRRRKWQYSVLRNPMDREAWQPTVLGAARGCKLSDKTEHEHKRQMTK